MAPLNKVLFVGASDPGDGTPNDPYEDLGEAIADPLTDGTRLILEAGSVYNLSATPHTINKDITLKGRDVLIR